MLKQPNIQDYTGIYGQGTATHSSSQRPTSAGNTRARSSGNGNSNNNVYQNVNNSANGRSNDNSNISAGYARNNAGGTNIFMGTGSNPITTSGLLGTGFTNNTASSSQRPSSAGHNRPVTQTISGQVHMQMQTQMQLPQGTNALPTANYNTTSAPGYSRPKSAGTTRRSDSNPNETNQYYLPQHNITYGASAQPLGAHLQYSNQQQSAQQQAYSYQIPIISATKQSSNNGNIFHQSGSGNHSSGQAQQQTRPLSASATTTHSHVPNNGSTQNANDHWSTSYKLHYGYAGVGSTAQVAQSSAATNNTQQITGQPQRPASSSATNRIRSAIDQSYKYTNPVDSATTNPVEADITTTDTGTLPINAGLDADNNGERQLLARDDDDDEMDGRPFSESRMSHPEVSTTTPSHSIELGGSIDVRNSSMDSLPDDIHLGISTIPNQFCSAKDALELKKILLLNKNSRGGIVPSSTAVMDMYMVGKVVGVGSYGKVRAAWHRLTGSKVAIKTYDKSKLKDPAHWKRVHSEIKIMEAVSHPRIARMYEAVETPKRMHLIMECLDGGNLCSYVKQKKRLSEDESKKIFFQILQAIEHLHVQGVSHRDVKLENVLFSYNDVKDVKLIDFGFSTFCQPGKRLKVFCGTPSYMAPEIVKRTEYEGRPVDIWSLGILLYALLCGCFPFRAKSYPDLYRKIARGTFNMPEELSVQARDLLRQLLTVDAAQRITAYSALRHPWLQVQFATSPDIDRLRLETPILISDRPTDDIDDQVMDELDKFGFTKEDMVRIVLTKTHSSIATLYYLLLDIIISKRKLLGGSKRAVSSYNTGGRSSNTNANTNNKQYLTQPLPTPAQYLASSNGSTGATNVSNVQLSQQPQLLFNKNQDYTLRPRSASATRPAGGNSQRPLSAYAGRR